MKRLSYEPIGDWSNRVVLGYQVRLACGARGVGETLADAVLDATLAKATIEARVERLRMDAEAESRRRFGDEECPF